MRQSRKRGEYMLTTKLVSLGLNGGLLVDALHSRAAAARSRTYGCSSPRGCTSACDAPIPGPDTVEGLIHAARCKRMLPSEGDDDLAALFAGLPGDLAIGIEVPSETRAPTMRYRAWSEKALAIAKAILDYAFRKPW